MDLNKLFEESKNTELWQWSSEPETGQFIAALMKMSGLKNVVEIGVFKGFTSAYMIDALPSDGKYLGIDIEDLREKEIVKVIDKLKKNVSWVWENSLDALTKIEQADFVFIDGLHEFEHNVKEFKLIEKFITKGGIIAIHDSEHIPDVWKFVQWVKQFDNFEVINLSTTDIHYHNYSRGLALIRCKDGK